MIVDYYTLTTFEFLHILNSRKTTLLLINNQNVLNKIKTVVAPQNEFDGNLNRYLQAELDDIDRDLIKFLN